MSEAAAKAPATEKQPLSVEELMTNYLYYKTFKCPVCNKDFMDILLRRSKLRSIGVDRDFRTRYHDIDPNLYEVTVCGHCGYAALHNYFDKILSKQGEWILEKITPNYRHVDHDIPFTPASALARYKQALACAQAMEAKSSTKAVICLKMAWLYRDAKDEKGELTLIRLSYTALKDAFSNENFPLGSMDEPTTMYMIAEMARRLGEFDEALKMIGNVITSRATPVSIKNKAQDMKELIKDKNRGLS